ncbi:alpha/beta fold hydrolase [Sinomonas sp. R1AF57]|uniref:alpha/beta fold hydrolase n=1 Tax=Sinomonas sp. R1AF57 TaxID=2020377 RepID=UPI000B5EBB33|nr:alpha/beta fold hydrolase [Sinomonas sp. R1AF57]ASN52782.1 alpha/beta hydrolase [Sinomonas sp. R1AF57]
MRRFGERQVVEGGRELWVYSGGAGSRDYVLVHGIGVSSLYYRPLAEVLAAHGRVHVVELPGFGKSLTPRRPLSIEDFAETAWEALDTLGIRDPVLIGHSMGAQVVVEMAIDRPSPRPIVLLGPTVNVRERTVPRQALRLTWDSIIEPFGVTPIVFGDYIRCGVPWYVRTLREMMRHRIEQRIPLVEAPILLMSGRRDPISPPSWLRTLAGLARSARTAVLDREAHVLMFRGAREVARSIVQEADRAEEKA